jgi:energy-coupling factor transporter ATP-binding protein EcfA2
VAFLVVEHVMGRLVPVVDRLVVMDFGRVIAEGSTEEVLQDARVREAYLGGGALGEAPPAADDTGAETAAEATGKRGPE